MGMGLATACGPRVLRGICVPLFITAALAPLGGVARVTVCMARHLLFCERCGPDSAGKTVRMIRRAACGASGHGVRRAPNKPPLQIRHRAALTITTAITFDPVLAGFGLARHDGTASVTAAKRNSVNGNRHAHGENIPRVNGNRPVSGDGNAWAYLDLAGIRGRGDGYRSG